MPTLFKIVLFILLCFVFIEPSLAQEGSSEIETVDVTVDTKPPEVIVNRNAEIKSLPAMEQVMLRVNMRQPEVTPVEIQSIFFTVDELSLLRQAKAGLITSLPGYSDEGALNEEVAPLTLEPIVREPGPRNVKLGGILYVSKTDWTVWINGEEVRPNAIPSRLLDIRVNNKYIEIEWYDTQTNQIYPIRLRPNQTFNLDARLFLPG